MITRIDLKPGNRMLRVGFGQNDGRWFARVDLWWVGFRLKREEPRPRETMSVSELLERARHACYHEPVPKIDPLHLRRFKRYDGVAW